MEEYLIGNLTLKKRTEYSKIQVFDKDGLRIEKCLEDKIIEDYEKQIKNPDKYFKIRGEALDYYVGGNDISYVFVPENVKAIMQSAFTKSDAKLIHLPNTIEYIGEDAFKDCEKLEEIVLPDSVHTLRDNAFYGCKKLRSAKMSEGMTYIPKYAFCVCNSLENLILSDSIKAINDYAFNWCRMLTKVNIPRDLEYVGTYPFVSSGVCCLSFNHNLNDIKDPRKNWGDILGNSGIYKIEINNSVTHIDPNFFRYTSRRLSEIDYLGTKEEFKQFKRENKHLFEIIDSVRINTKEDLDGLISKNTAKREDFSMRNSWLVK